MDKKRTWLLIGLFSFSYFCVKYAIPGLWEGLFDAGNYAFLNKVCSLSGEHPFWVYAGYLEERVIGPISQVLASAVLVLISLNFFERSSKRVFILAVFVYLIITKFEALFFPCYGEMGAGPLAEAIWLFKHKFDYVGLLHQNNVDTGGPKVYMFSIYPTFVAALLTIISSAKVFVFLYHIIMFALGAVVVALFRDIARKVFDSRSATLAAVLLLSLPLFQAMVELVNMEVLCLTFVVLSAYFLVNRRMVLAGGAAILAVLAKGPGGIACGAVFAVSLLQFAFDPQKKWKWRWLLWGAVVFILGLAKLYLLRTFVSPEQTPAGTITFLIGWAPLSRSKFILALSFFSAIAFIVYLFRGRNPGKIKERLWASFPVLLSLIFVAGWIGLYLNVSVMGPRYKLLLAPFLVLSALFAFRRIIPSQKAFHAMLVITILLAALGSYGLFHSKKIPSSTYSFNNLERTLEYRNDLKLDMLIVKTLQEKYSGYTVGAPFVIAQILAMPALGYVTEPRDVVIYGMSVFYGGIRNFEGLKHMDLERTIWVGFDNGEVFAGVDFPIDRKNDRIEQELRVGDKKATLFRGGFAIEKVRQIVQYVRLKKFIQSQGRQ